MRFDLSFLRCVVSLSVFMGLTVGTAFAETNLEVVVHDCPNGNEISSLSSQQSTAHATEEDGQYELWKQLAIQEFTCSENANVNEYSRKLAKLFYADDLFNYAGDDNLSAGKRYALDLDIQDVYKDIIENGGFPDISRMAQKMLPLVKQEIKRTATLL